MSIQLCVQLGSTSWEIKHNQTLSHKFLGLIVVDYRTNQTQSLDSVPLFGLIEFDYLYLVGGGGGGEFWAYKWN